MKEWHLIESQPLLNDIFKERQIISSEKGRSLKDRLERATMRTAKTRTWKSRTPAIPILNTDKNKKYMWNLVVLFCYNKYNEQKKKHLTCNDISNYLFIQLLQECRGSLYNIILMG